MFPTQQNHTNPRLRQQDDSDDDPEFDTFFCRALYDYTPSQTSELSFRRNDVIEVLSQQPSGWWDGLLGGSRGWFPSNYVVVISREEAADLALAATDFGGA
ncbi:hypothetical protein AX16_002458 [Volvariella volvacea WC 439]|nr:hypothetical protein AX16_002458 [Volvariella volvacea WC 439]